MRRTGPSIYLIVAIFLLAAVSIALGRITYADESEVSANNGSSWADAGNPPELSDINGDRFVDFNDYAILAQHRRQQECTEPLWCQGKDIDRSGRLDVLDLANFADNWLQPCTYGEGQLEITNVRLIRGEFVKGRFEEIEKVDRLKVGDVFVVEVRVSNTSDTTAYVTNLYTSDLASRHGVELVGIRSVCLYLLSLAPGESALLYPVCSRQAFMADRDAWVRMNIQVSESCERAFSFRILPSDGIEVTDVEIIKGELVNDKFQAIEEVEQLYVGDIFRVQVEVTNQGDTTEHVLNLYQWDLYPEDRVGIVGVWGVCLYPIELAPGESAVMSPFCFRAFQAQEAGWVIMNIEVPDWYSVTLRKHPISFEILPAE